MTEPTSPNGSGSGEGLPEPPIPAPQKQEAPPFPAVQPAEQPMAEVVAAELPPAVHVSPAPQETPVPQETPAQHETSTEPTTGGWTGWPSPVMPPAPPAVPETQLPQVPQPPTPTQPWSQPVEPTPPAVAPPVEPAWSQPVEPTPPAVAQPVQGAWSLPAGITPVSVTQPAQPAWSQNVDPTAPQWQPAGPPVPQPAWSQQSVPVSGPVVSQPAWGQPAAPVAYSGATPAYPAAYAAAYPAAYPPAAVPAAKGAARRFVLPIITALLGVALVATAGFAYTNNQSLNNDLTAAKTSLANEKSARSSAEHQVTDLKNCLTAMDADLSDLQKLQSDGKALLDRMTGNGGDWSTARTRYEDALLEAYDDAKAAIVDLANGNNSRAVQEVDAMVTAEQSATTALNTLQGMNGTISSGNTKLGTDLTTLQSKMAQTKQTCDAAAG